MIDKWDIRFLEKAALIASWSKDPSTQTGAVIVDGDRRTVSEGYNGFPKGMFDTPQRYADREFKYRHIVHCERNAMLFAKRDITGCTLYTWPFMSCVPCASMVRQSGIVRCVAPYSDNPRWQADFKETTELFAESGVVLELVDESDLQRARAILAIARNDVHPEVVLQYFPEEKAQNIA
jgi:dCMP deaminase